MAKKTVPAPSAAPTSPLNLAPTDWFLAPWRKTPPWPRPAPPPLDLKDCLARVAKLNPSGDYMRWDWERANLPDVMTREEAHFWLAAMTGTNTGSLELATRLGKQSFDGRVALKDARTHMGQEHRPTNEVLLPLANLLSLKDLIQLFHAPATGQLQFQLERVWPRLLGEIFARRVFPYLTEADRSALRPLVLPYLDPKTWGNTQQPLLGAYVAALLGMSEELLALAASWPDGQFAWMTDARGLQQEPQRLVFGLNDPRLVQHHVRRLKGLLVTPFLIRGWLAHTELGGLDFLRDTVLAQTNKKQAEELLTEIASLVRAPEMAPFMLELQLGSKAPALARKWLDDNLDQAVAGLQATAAGHGKLAEAAGQFLQDARAKGHAGAGAAFAPAEAIAAPEPRKGPAPKWLATALSAPRKKSKLPDWADPVVFPAVRAGDFALDRDEVRALLEALQQSDLQAPQPLVSAVKANADRPSLEAFAWKLFELWQGAGSPAKEKWAFHALGHFGGNDAVMKLTPLLRAWPGESQHARAVVGLEVLRAIGSDLALTQLNGIAQKLKFQALKNKAQELMEAIARDRGLSREELADRIVPTLDLDTEEARTFDFGPRRFQLVLDGPRPQVRDESGTIKADLPKPGKSDDAAKATAATERWKALKKQLKEVGGLQVARLEQAMVTGRRWSVADFETLLVGHPLLSPLVRRLLWGVYDKSGKLTHTFQVTEAGQYLDKREKPVKLDKAATVGIVHPLHLDEADRANWAQKLSAASNTPPFVQLDRPVHRLLPREEDNTILKRFAKVKAPSAALKSALEKGGWVRGYIDQGAIEDHSLHFPGADVTAVLHTDPDLLAGGLGYDMGQTHSIPEVLFRRGAGSPLHLGEVDPVVMSEVLHFLTSLPGAP
jgi:hypothetical protein